MSNPDATAQTGARTAAAPPPAPRRGLSIAVVLIGVFVSSLDLFIVNIAFPDLGRTFRSATLSGLSWVLSAYAITFAALLMPAGRWADRSGRKRAYLIGLALFTVASAACAAADSLGLLVAARVLQAVGGALMLPSSLGLLLPLFPPNKRGAAIGLWSAMGGAAAALGPPIGGLLVQIDWRWVFIVNLPIGALTVLIGIRTLREVREEHASGSDPLGALVLAATVGAVVAAIVQGQSWGWHSPRVLGLFALGGLGIVFSARRAFRHPAPVIEPAVFRVRTVALADLATAFFFAGFGAMILASTLFLTQIWGHSVLRAGLEISAGPIAAAFFAVPGGILAAKYGARPVGFAGSVLFAAGGVLWATAPGAHPDYLGTFLPAGIIAGIGSGLALPSLSGAATLPLPPERFATGTAMVSMCRQVGLALGVAAVAAVLAVHPDVAAFHRTFLFMTACGLAGGLTLLLITAGRTPLEPEAEAGVGRPTAAAERHAVG
ncbi:MFS transporter [Actinocrinis puniceicyclus]|uniref:MFS transporter n=1 Tax=Actinocrinis puniceicyclus TaxID=977794 RepID=A0A8J8BDQ2_9ACTN|nr:MFS transporter [Actinocrinis puniceicyclus]MBS2964401.1 MFS transporter [Actinocrinis puniceicyclus]